MYFEAYAYIEIYKHKDISVGGKEKIPSVTVGLYTL